MTREIVRLEQLIGQLMRNGKTIYYAYVDNVLIERYTLDEMLQLLKRAREAGQKVGA